MILDSVRQSSGCPDEGNGAVAQADELAQPARLKAGRHQKQVAAGVDPLRQAGVKMKVNLDLAAVARLQVPEELLVALLAGAEQHNLNGQLHQPPGSALDEVEAFLG